MTPRFLAGLALVMILFGVSFDVQTFGGTFSAAVMASAVIVFYTLLMARGPKGEVMAGNEGVSRDSPGRQARISRLTDAEKEEIIQGLFDKIYVEVGRSVVKRIGLAILSAIVAFLVWLGKDHISLK